MKQIIDCQNNYAILALDESGAWRTIAYAQYLDTALGFGRGKHEWTNPYDATAITPQISVRVVSSRKRF